MDEKVPTAAASDAAWEAFTVARAGTPLGGSLVDETRAALDAAITVTVYELQAQIEDRGVRNARDHNWCGVFNRVMWEIFPAGPLDGEDWRDSDGTSCDGSRWRDADGYDRDGYDRNGRDRDGFDRYTGRDRGGFDRDGRDVNGLNRDDPKRYVYDTEGYDIDGFHYGGSVVYGLTRDSLAERRAHPERYVYDISGVTIDGVDREGYGRDGFNQAGFNRAGRDRDGYDQRGFRNPAGLRRREHRSGLTRRRKDDGYDVAVDEHGFDWSGYFVDPESNETYLAFDKEGFNVLGTHKLVPGLTREQAASVTA